MKICVLGTHPLAGAGPKVGIQHIAETLADFGHDVLYVTSHASPLMLLHPRHRGRFLRTTRPLPVAPGLRQVTPLNLVPARVRHRLEAAPGGRLVAALDGRFERSRGRILEGAPFDVCICSSAATMTLLDRIRATRIYYRMNDLLSGFHGVPAALREREAALLRSGRLDGVWAVNEQLADFARGVSADVPVRVVPNGVDRALFARAAADPELARTRDRNVVYVGGIEPWTDVALLWAAARLLPDHHVHVYGPWAVERPADTPSNVHVHGAVPHHEIPSKLVSCAVGVIPSGSGNAHRLVEKPIKFYEYLAAGLGVAVTPLAGRGLEPFATVGDTPASFAQAILAAPAAVRLHRAAIEAAVERLDWDTLVREMLPDA